LVYLRIFAVCEWAIALYRLGRWEECAAVLNRAGQLPASGVADIFLQLRLAALEVGRGEFDAAETRLDHSARLSDKTPDTQWVAPLTEHRAELAIWRGRPDLGRQIVRGGLDILLSVRGSQLARQGPIYTLGIRAEADLATEARVRRSQEGVRECRLIGTGYLAPLQAVASGVAENQPAFAPLAEAYSSLGAAEVSRLEGRSEPTTWGEAADAWQGLEMTYPEAYARFRQAEALLQTNQSRRTALEALRRAYHLACVLGAAPLLKEVRELGRRSRLELDDLSELPQAKVVDPIHSYGLTPREREVLERLASGQTNRQIAEQLFISEKTASVHVSNILRKLSAGSRTEAAGIAYRLNLVGSPPTEP